MLFFYLLFALVSPRLRKWVTPGYILSTLFCYRSAGVGVALYVHCNFFRGIDFFFGGGETCAPPLLLLRASPLQLSNTGGDWFPRPSNGNK